MALLRPGRTRKAKLEVCGDVMLVRFAIIALMLSSLSACVAGAVVGAAVGVTGAVVGTAVKTTGAVVDAAIPDDDDDDDDDDD